MDLMCPKCKGDRYGVGGIKFCPYCGSALVPDPVSVEKDKREKAEAAARAAARKKNAEAYNKLVPRLNITAAGLYEIYQKSGQYRRESLVEVFRYFKLPTSFYLCKRSFMPEDDPKDVDKTERELIVYENLLKVLKGGVPSKTLMAQMTDKAQKLDYLFKSSKAKELERCARNKLCSQYSNPNVRYAFDHVFSVASTWIYAADVFLNGGAVTIKNKKYVFGGDLEWRIGNCVLSGDSVKNGINYYYVLMNCERVTPLLTESIRIAKAYIDSVLSSCEFNYRGIHPSDRKLLEPV